MPIVLLTPDQVAQRLGFARSTLAKLRVKGGGPPFVKLAAAVRYPADSLDEWIASHKTRQSTADAA